MSKGTLLYAQSGGVTAVINATAAAVIEAARARRVRVLAARNGILGALREELIEASRLSVAQVRGLANTPGGAFGSCRVKLKSLEEDRARYERLLEVFRAHQVRWFLYNGGNDSADTALKISQLAESSGYELTCVGVPKTIDNDLAVTDSCPGFGSAAKYTAVSVLEAAYDVAAMADTSTKVFVYEVMGRHAGWPASRRTWCCSRRFPSTRTASWRGYARWWRGWATAWSWCPRAPAIRTAASSPRPKAASTPSGIRSWAGPGR